MCLAIPGKVLEIQEDAAGVRMGKTDFAGVIKQVCLEYTPEVNRGDYVLVHVGFALGKVDEDEAQRTYRALEELNQLTELETQTDELPVQAGSTPLPFPEEQKVLLTQQRGSSP
jgi:hydrogenase expression/formation protein HypC